MNKIICRKPKALFLFLLLTPALYAQGVFPLWDSGTKMPVKNNIPVLEDVTFSVVKPYEFEKDGYRFLHGVAIIWHKGKLYASFGHNKNGENTVTEEANYRVSKDGGLTWGPLKKIGGGGHVAVSHGEFLSHNDSLWAFQGEYDGIMQNLQMRAFLLKARESRTPRHNLLIRTQLNTRGNFMWAIPITGEMLAGHREKAGNYGITTAQNWPLFHWKKLQAVKQSCSR